MVPKILLIGAGRFGRNHLRVLRELHGEGVITFSGLVVRTPKSRKAFEKEFMVATYDEVTPALLKSVDGVVIATPPETHFELAKDCLKYTNVFIEKPIAETEKEARALGALAKKYKRTMVVGHIFRHHPVAHQLKTLLKGKGIADKITGHFLNPQDTDQGREASLELLHLFDIVDYIWPKTPVVVNARKQGRVSMVDIRYAHSKDGRFVLGWTGTEKKRTLSFTYPKLSVEADFVDNTVTVTKDGVETVISCPIVVELIRSEHLSFIEKIKSGKIYTEDHDMPARIVAIAQKATSKKITKPKVAVIGGGIFGTSIASELSKSYEVTLFEKNSELLQEASLVNCFRHHYGYHYPRSDATVHDVQRSRLDFEKIFKKAIIATPTYYALAAKDSYVSLEEFIRFCKKHKLPYKKEYPKGGVLDKESVDLSIRVPEPSYHHGKLKKIVEERILKDKNITVLFDTKVLGCELTQDKKIITYSTKGKKEKEKEFDFVVNATYAHINTFASWLGFQHFPIRVDLAEVLVIRLPVAPVSVTVIDGPFATLMPTGYPNEFVLYHVKESIIHRYVHNKGLVNTQLKGQSNREAIMRESLPYFPILKDAEFVSSRIVHRGVEANREHDDSRVADLIDHGFGCWSVLSGKILSSVTTGKRLASILKESLL